MKLTIRKAFYEDWQVIAGFQRRMAFETERINLEPAVIEPGVKAVFDNPGTGQYYVAVDGSTVIGCLLITFEWSDWRNNYVWWIQSLYIVPEYRKKGVFRALYEYIKGLVKQDSHVSGIRLYVDKSNLRAMQAYQALGMNGEHYQVFEWMKNE